MLNYDIPALDLRSLNKLTMHFKDFAAEERYQSSTESIRRLQMRLALLSVGVLYIILGVLDLHILTGMARHQASVIHISQGCWLLIFSVLLFSTKSLRLHTLAVSLAVLVAWSLNLLLTMHGNANFLYGEEYLMIVWVWMISGLTLTQAARINLLFLFILAISMYESSNIVISAMLGHQFFLFCSVVLGALGAYLTEFYKRQLFVSIEMLAKQTNALVLANDRLGKDRRMLTKLSKAVEQSGEAILITDSDAIIEYVNPTFTKITGYPSNEIIGEIPTILRRSSGTSLSMEMWNALRLGEAWSGSRLDCRKDGSIYPVLLSVAPVQDDDGKIIHYVITQKDMTEYQHLEEQLRHAQKMEAIGTLVGGIAHDFNNTLAGITGNIYLLKKDENKSTQTLKILDRIEGLAFRSADMVKQLLAFSRKGIVRMHEMNVTSFLYETAKLYEATLPDNISFTYDFSASGSMTVSGDYGQLERAVINLLNNARDAIVDVKSPEIELRLDPWMADNAFKKAHPSTHGEEFACISVVDNGCGIDKEMSSHIFEPFFTTKRMKEGTGLGLSMVYGTVQSHRGAISVESEPGKGTSVRLYLPLLADNVADNIVPKFEEITASGSGSTVLLADDSDAVLSIVTEVLESLGYRVLVATDGKQAIDLYREFSDEIELVILDVMMPKMGCITVSKEIRDINSGVKMIFMTGYDTNQQINTKEMISEVIIQKPFKVAEFSRLVKSTLDRDSSE